MGEGTGVGRTMAKTPMAQYRADHERDKDRGYREGRRGVSGRMPAGRGSRADREGNGRGEQGALPGQGRSFGL